MISYKYGLRLLLRHLLRQQADLLGRASLRGLELVQAPAPVEVLPPAAPGLRGELGLQRLDLGGGVPPLRLI